MQLPPFIFPNLPFKSYFRADIFPELLILVRKYNLSFNESSLVFYAQNAIKNKSHWKRRNHGDKNQSGLENAEFEISTDQPGESISEAANVYFCVCVCVCVCVSKVRERDI